MRVLFWLSLILVGYTHAGYPLLLRLLTIRRRRCSDGKSPVAAETVREGAAGVSVVIVAHNEADRIADRIANLRQCDIPGGSEIVVVCDGCTDGTAALARASEGEPPVRVIVQECRLGKASGLNRAMSEARGDLLVFADARQKFERDAVRKLLAPFADPAVAAVSGNLDIAASRQGTGAGIDAYWRLERVIRRLESELGSVIGCTGAIYALRRRCFEPLPPDTILDDVVIPMRALAAGGRVLFESGAVAFDPQELAPEVESRRKIRTLAGNFQILFRYPAWLLPWRNRAWWQLISHKYLRLAGPVFLLGCLVSAGILAGGSLFFRAALLGQAFCYALALVGMTFRGVRAPLFTVPAGFVFLQWQALRALFHYLRLRRTPRSGAWP